MTPRARLAPRRHAGADHFAQGLLARDPLTPPPPALANPPKPTIAMRRCCCIDSGWTIAAAMDIVCIAEDVVFVPSYGERPSGPTRPTYFRRTVAEAMADLREDEENGGADA